MPTDDAARTTDKLAAAHARFATAALWIYFGAALVALSLLLATVLTDKSHNDEQGAQQLLLETEVLAHRVGDHLALRLEELQRLATRSEVNLLDESLDPERALLDMAHQDSPLFNLGVAILDGEGRVLWAEPRTFMPPDAMLGAKPWFLETRDHRLSRIVQPSAKEPALYVV